MFLCQLDRVVKTLKCPDEVQLDQAKQNPEYLQDSKIVWKVNFSRFHREFRDLLIVQAVQRRIDASAGNLMRVMLTLMNETSPILAHNIIFKREMHLCKLESIVLYNSSFKRCIKSYLSLSPLS